MEAAAERITDGEAAVRGALRELLSGTLFPSLVSLLAVGGGAGRLASFASWQLLSWQLQLSCLLGGVACLGGVHASGVTAAWRAVGGHQAAQPCCPSQPPAAPQGPGPLAPFVPLLMAHICAAMTHLAEPIRCAFGAR